MKKLNLEELAKKLQEEQLMKKDYVIPSTHLKMVNGKIVVYNPTKDAELSKILYESGISTVVDDSQQMELDLLPIAHEQIASKLGIPKPFYDRLLNSKQEVNLPCLEIGRAHV